MSNPQYPEQPAQFPGGQYPSGQYPSGQYPGGEHGDRPAPSRPGTLLAGCIMTWVGSAFGLLFGVIFVAASGSDELLDQFASADRDGAQSLLQILGVVLILSCVLAFAFSILAFMGRRWAAVALAVLGGLWIALALYGLVNSGDPSGLVGVAYVIAATALVFSGSKEWFDHKSREGVSY